MIYIFNTRDKFIQSYTEYTDNIYKRVIGGEWSFTFETPINPVFIKGYKIGFYDKENKFRLCVIDSVEEDFEENTATVTCLNDYTTLDFTFIEDKRVIEGTCTQAMTKLLENSDYTVGNIEVVDSQNINFYFASRLEGLNEILDIFGGELDIRIEFEGNKITKKIIDIKQKLGTDTGLRCTYDTNLTSLKRIQLEEKFFNRLYGFGEALETEGGGYTRKLTFEDEVWIKPTFPIDKPLGQKYVEDLESIAKWGVRTGKVEVKTKDTSILIQETYKKLLRVADPRIGYVTTVKDIRNIEGFEHYVYTIGDTINILEETNDVTITSRIIEESYDIDLLEDIKIVLGTPFKSLSDDEEYDIREEVESIVGDMDLTVDVDDTNFPNSIPTAPTGEAIGGLDTISVRWLIESKSYYEYEVYASTSKGFTPNFANRVFKGKASYYIHKCRPKETWYFKVRGVNTAHNISSNFSEEITGSTAKVADGTTYFESGAIGDALIGTLRADRAWIGKIKSEYINLLEIVVGDENNPTFHIDSFARLYANFESLQINSSNVSTEQHVSNKMTDAINISTTYTNAQIKQVNDEIAMKVSKDIYDKNNDLINKEFTEIKATSNKISQAVGEIDRNYIRSSQFIQTIETIEMKFFNNNDPNILKNTSFLNDWKYWGWNGNFEKHIYSDGGFKDGNTVRLELTDENQGLFQRGVDCTQGAAIRVYANASRPVNITIGIEGIYEKTYTIGQGDGWSELDVIVPPIPRTGTFILYTKAGGPHTIYANKIKVQRGDTCTPWCGHSEEIYSNTALFDKEGMKIKHNNGSMASFTHEAIDFLNPQGNTTLRVKDGGFNFHTWNRNKEMVGFIKSSYSGNTDYNGVTLSTYGNGDYVSMGVSESTDENGWNSIPFISCIPHGNVPSYPQGRGIHLANAPIFVRHVLNIEQGSFISVKNNTEFPHEIFNSSGGFLILAGNDRTDLSIREGSTARRGLSVIEDGGALNKVKMESWGHWDFKNFTMYNMHMASRLNPQSSYLKARNKDINESYAITSMTDGEIRYTCRETQHITDKTLIIELPQIMSENIELDYHVNISKLSWGDYRIIEKNTYYFEIETNVDDFSFTYEVIAKQIEKPISYTSIASEQYNLIEKDELEDRPIIQYAEEKEDKKQYWKLYKR